MPETSFALIKAVVTLVVLGALFAFLFADHRRNLPTPRDPEGGRSEREP
jgi:hypothetical protein